MEGGHAGNRPHLIDSDFISLAFVKEELTHLILPPETLVVLNKGVKRVERDHDDCRQGHSKYK